MENLQVLTGKYGEEGDRLIFKILNSGNFLENISESVLAQGAKKLVPEIAEKALRYDLTVPFARYVVMNRNDIHLPFKRFQIQPVWRGDRPQKGRYCEFYQCDADVVGTNSLLCEAEIVLMINDVFQAIGLENFTIKINNRKILEGIAQQYQLSNHLTDVTVAIDKLDKIGVEGVAAELIARGINEGIAREVVAYFTGYNNLDTDNESKLNYFLQAFVNNNIEIGIKGVEEIKEILELVNISGIKNAHVEVDVSLARGLSYYTGAIFEVKANKVEMGSISGGGRYDNLTGVFGLPGISGVGISFGVDRIYDVMEELELFPSKTFLTTKVLFCCFDPEGAKASFSLLKRLRDNGIASELYPDVAKLRKQLEYANKKNIPFVVIVGEEELKNQVFTLKNMLNGAQLRLSPEDLIDTLIH
jgi:histidyl-tRNA synthetase